jgi:hypothetical protein
MWLTKAKLIMELDLCPPITLSEGTFNVLIAPDRMFINALNGHLNLQRFKTLYISWNNSGILSKLDRRFTDLDVRRSFTAYQLLTILEELHHSLVIIEHDPSLYEDTKELPDYVSRAMREAARNAIVVLYSQALDRYIDEIAKAADRVFCISTIESEKPSRSKQNNCPRTEVNQTTLGAF